MSGLPWRLACCLALFLPIALAAQAPSSPPAPQLLSPNMPWQAVGPNQIVTPQFGDVTGRVTSIAIAPWDASGNTVYLGSTGGGVWRSTNAAASDASGVAWQPLTDDLPAYSGVNITSLSIGTVSVQPGSSVDGVVLAGTGDPNGAVDSYYGAGILRSADGGTTWSLITESQDGFSGGVTNYSFAGDAFSGFAWSTTSTNLVVAALTDSYDGFVNDINNSNTDNVAEAGLYYSTDAGQTWFLSTIEDGPNQVIQSSQTTVPSAFPGVPVSSVVWNAVRKMFYAAVEYHGYYQSSDGVTWTRMANQPSTALTAGNCPFDTQSNSCVIFRGVLAVQPNTGDMFALSVDSNSVDQGLWQDVCNAGANGCTNATVQFGVNIPDAPLDDGTVSGTIPQGTYNLTLAAVPNGTDTLLFAGTQDIFRCSVAAGCMWRNTTNTTSCVSGKVAPAQHAMAFLAPLAGQTLPLLYFGNDSGLWRSADGVNQTGAACAASDAAHFQNLNGGLGSLAEVTGLANSTSNANVVLGGFGVNGSAARTNTGQTAWLQLLSGEGGLTAIDPSNPDNWYAALGPYVAIGQCTQGANCTAADFSSAVGASETAGDESLLNAPYALDPVDSANSIVGTCRVWRGPASGGTAWSSANAISPMLDGQAEPSCGADAEFPNALIRSLAAGGANVQPGTGTQHNGAQAIYAGMAGLLDGGGSTVAGHVFSTQSANTANGTARWTDLALSPVANEQSYNGVFNPDHFDVSAIYVDPHDTTGNTVYAAIQGFGAPHLYLSTNGGANWTNVTENLPDLPLNDVLVDPNDASVVYVASDGGVFVTQNIANCEGIIPQCWNPMGTGLPLAPAVKLTTISTSDGYLRVGTYGRGIWQIPLLSGGPQTTMTVDPSSLTFNGQPVQSTSGPKTITVTNTGTSDLTINNITVTGDFFETDTCSGASVAPESTCKIQVTFTPSATGTRTGTLTVSANVSGSQQSVSLTGNGVTQSAIVLLPASVGFAAQQLNTVSTAQQVTISNTSGNSIALNSESVTGPFAIQVDTCSTSLPSNTGCTLAIVFQPTQPGPASGVLTVVSGQGTETISLSGSGENGPTDTLAPASLTFPPTLENAASTPQTITLTNSGGLALTGITVQTNGDFAVVDGCGNSLNAQSACTLTVRYTPHSIGAEVGSITVTDALRIQTILLSGTGLGPPTDTLSASSIIFPATVIGHSAAPQTATLTNSGDSALTQLNIQAVGAGFGETNSCGSTLAAHSSCIVTGTFQPLSPGTATGQIDVVDALRTQIISLSGSGETPAQDNLSPLSLSFGDQSVGSVSTSQTVTLSNNLQATLTGIRLQSGNPNFMFTTTCSATLQPGNSCAISVAFAPHAVGADTGMLSVIDANRTQQVPLTGTGTLAHVMLTPETLNFAATGIQTSSPAQTLLLSNGSTGAMSGITLAVSGPFAATSNCGSSLPSGATCSISVMFSPTATGIQNGAITINSSDTSALTTPVAGVGISYQLLPTSSTSASVTSGNAASYSLELVPVNGSTGSASLTCSNLPPNSTCTVTPATASLVAPADIQVAIATGVESVAAGSLRTRRAEIAASLPWPLELLLVLFPLCIVRRRYRSLKPWLGRMAIVLLLVATAASVTACGKGGGPLDVATPLPTSSLTPAGTYAVIITAAAGGLQKSVNLTLVVQ